MDHFDSVSDGLPNSSFLGVSQTINVYGLALADGPFAARLLFNPILPGLF